MTTQSPETSPDATSWALLLLLSAIWGASFMFIGVAVKDLSALQIVLARVVLAALLLLPVHWFLQGPLPRDGHIWVAAGGMSILNNIVPFLLITWGQHHIASGLASVVNATTPIFAAVFMAMAGLEGITPRKALALVIGLAGVAILQGINVSDLNSETLGILAVMGGAMFYGLSAPWSKTRLKGIAPLSTATCQLLLSAIGMAVIVALFGDVGEYADMSGQTVWALIGLAGLSTSFAYLLFFKIIARAGPSFVSLCTMIIPLSAILLGFLVLDEKLNANEVAGALVIGLALAIIDGRPLRWFGLLKAAPTPRP
jgi:drug/metabolite transporter (DMT)-like permease